MVVVLFGVTGTGKTRIGRALAMALGWLFIDADDYHEEVNLKRLQQGIALQDKDRWPWLTRLRGTIQRLLEERRNAVLACSALKRSYRRHLRAGHDVLFVYLRTEPKALKERLRQRQGHFASPLLLKSQLAELEEPFDETLTIDTTHDPATIVSMIKAVIEDHS